jgi:hypothetical protein
MKSYVRIADITFCFFASEGLTLSDESCVYRGFGCEPATDADYTIEVRIADEPHVIDRSAGYLGEGENIGHTWHILQRDGAEIFTTLLESNPKYLTARLTLNGRDGLLELYPKTPTTEVDAYLFPMLNLMMARVLHVRNGILVHSSVVDDGGKGYLFTAVSGTGKSTMARIWQSCGATIVNDDMNVLSLTNEDIVRATNIPMPYYNAKPTQTTLKAIFLISQSPTNFIRPVSGAVANLRFFANTIYHALNKDVAAHHLSIVNGIAARLPMYELGFKPDADIVDEVRRLNL